MLAPRPIMRDHAGVSRRQLRTSNYPPEARVRLGEAVEKARIAACYPTRPAFCRAHGIKNLRGLELLEHGETGVGQKFLFEVARALGWDADTPKVILDGGPIPPPPELPGIVDVTAAEDTPANEPTLAVLQAEYVYFMHKLDKDDMQRLFRLLDMYHQLQVSAGATQSSTRNAAQS